MANKVYIAPETAITWTNSTVDETLDLGSLASSAVAMGSFVDLGAVSRAVDYEATLLIDGFDTVPVVGEAIHLYFSQGNTTALFDGPPSTTPESTVIGGMAAAELPNCLFVGPVIVVTTVSTLAHQARFNIRLTGRYVAPVVQNKTADALLGTADAHTLILVPIPPEVQ